MDKKRTPARPPHKIIAAQSAEVLDTRDILLSEEWQRMASLRRQSNHEAPNPVGVGGGVGAKRIPGSVDILSFPRFLSSAARKTMQSVTHILRALSLRRILTIFYANFKRNTLPQRSTSSRTDSYCAMAFMPSSSLAQYIVLRFLQQRKR